LLNNEYRFPDLIRSIDENIVPRNFENNSYYSILYSRFQNNVESIKICKEVFFKNSLFRKGFYINCGTAQNVLIFKIVELFSIETSYLIIGQEYVNYRFSKDYNCFIGGLESNNFKILEFDEILGLSFNFHKMSNGQFAFKIKNI
jgi:hypothetical protein